MDPPDLAHSKYDIAIDMKPHRFNRLRIWLHIAWLWLRYPMFRKVWRMRK